MQNINRRVVLASRPKGYPQASDFRIEEEPIRDLDPGSALVRTHYLSLDPYMRMRLSDAPSYVPPIAIGEVIVGSIVGEVVRSNTDAFAVGDIVEGRLGWQEYGMARPDTVRKVPFPDIPLSTALGILGMPGMTAYFGLLEIGRPIPGDTVVVSAASGAVGAIVGQIAKLNGCRVVGIAGSDKKVAYVIDELGFDAGINHRSTEDMGAALDAACPDGIDVYFDNVGGRADHRCRHGTARLPGACRHLRPDLPVQPRNAAAGSQRATTTTHQTGPHGRLYCWLVSSQV